MVASMDPAHRPRHFFRPLGARRRALRRADGQASPQPPGDDLELLRRAYDFAADSTKRRRVVW